MSRLNRLKAKQTVSAIKIQALWRGGVGRAIFAARMAACGVAALACDTARALAAAARDGRYHRTGGLLG